MLHRSDYRVLSTGSYFGQMRFAGESLVIVQLDPVARVASGHNEHNSSPPH